MNVVGGDNDGSGEGSGSGSGDESGDNEITEAPTELPTTDDNSIEEDNMLGGGVSDGGDVMGKRDGKNKGQTLKAMNTLLFTMLALVYINLRWC